MTTRLTSPARGERDGTESAFVDCGNTTRSLPRRRAKRLRVCPDPMPISRSSDHSHSVLVVEDNSIDRYTITIALERKDVSVIVAEDGAEALQWLKTQRFCLVVLDLVMPKVDGYAVIRYVVENAPDLPIVAVTGLSPDELSGVDRRVVVDVVSKPYNAKELADRIVQICAERDAEANRK